MITDLLLAVPWLVPLGLAAALALGPLLGWWLVDRPRIAWALAGLSIVPVAVLTLVPVERELFDVCVVQWALPTLTRVELLANLALFVPPVLAAGVASRRPVLAALGGSALSAGIETVQALVPAIGRSCDTTDWLSNTIGAATGAALAASSLALARRAADQ